jgi:hypothetical protein
VKTIYLFGISHSVARTAGYGFGIKADGIAMGNWAQFARIRYEVGPVASVLGAIYNKLFDEEQRESAETAALRYTLKCFGEGGVEIEFDGLWQTLPD